MLNDSMMQFFVTVGGKYANSSVYIFLIWCDSKPVSDTDVHEETNKEQWLKIYTQHYLHNAVYFVSTLFRKKNQLLI